VVQEIFGVHEHIKDLCRRIAKAGYFAIAPELYARQGDPSKYTDIPKLISEVVAKVPDEQVMRDLDACVAYAKTTGKVESTRLGITGFCWGGRIVYLYAAHNRDVKAAVAWYGSVRPFAPGTQAALDVAAKIKAPVLGLYGGADEGIPAATVEQMFGALRASGNTKSEYKIYPGTPHGFNADYRPTYRKAEAQDAWNRMIAWFKLNL
jgi:carboxymethylenebutenolidase